MQIANETILIIMASLIKLGTSTNDGLCGVRKLKNNKRINEKKFFREFTHDQLY